METFDYTQKSLSLKEKAMFLLALFGCGLSILPLPLAFLGLWPMHLSVPLLVSPALLLLLGLWLYTRKFQTQQFAQHYSIGFLGGLLATLCYDGTRVFGLYWRFQGFQVIHKFGMLLTGHNEFTWVTATMGWLYHFMNGGVFGITYALLWGKRGNVWWGILWGLVLELGMLASYPKYFGLNMSLGSVALTFSMLGHIAYGSVLGYCVARVLKPQQSLAVEVIPHDHP